MAKTEDFVIPEEALAQKLSEQFKDVPFLATAYHSGVDTGWTSVYINGEPVESVQGREGDKYKSSAKIFNNLFGIKKSYSVIDEYLVQNFAYSPYELSSFAFLKYRHRTITNE